jgi:signal-transduction protein with cAMP-binding, CBS, and nucleotidyltransferase domain
MSTLPISIKPSFLVKKAAQLMKQKDISSLIVVEGEKPIGMLTEKDIIEKVVAKDKKPSEQKIKDVMSVPLLTIHSSTSIKEAMRLMTKLNMHRFPVIKDKKLVGMITYKDIIRISPAILDILEEHASINQGESHSNPSFLRGKCEECGVLTDHLINRNDRFLCEDCAELLK